MGMNLPIENQLDRRSMAEFGANLTIAFVSAHDLLGQTQADARAFLFGGEKGNKNLPQGFFFNALARVAYLHNDLSGLVNKAFQMNLFLLSFLQRLNGIVHQVYEDLLNLRLISK